MIQIDLALFDYGKPLLTCDPLTKPQNRARGG